MMATRRDALAAALLGLTIRRTRAEEAHTFRILMILERDREGPVEAGFREYLAEHGVAAEILVRGTGGDRKQLRGIVEEARELRPDLVYTFGADITLAVVGRYDRVDPRRHIVDIPVVYTMVSSPKGTKIVAARRSSGRNVTGVDHTVPVVTQIRAMRAYRPLSRLAVVYNPTEENSLHNVRQLRELTKKAGFELIEEPVPEGADGQSDATALPGLVAALARREPQFLYLGADELVQANADAVTATAAENRLATFAVSEAAVSRSGALIGLVNRERNVGRYTAFKATQILLEGIPPADIPNDTLARPSYLVNMAVARSLDLYPPMAMVGYAEIVGV